MYAFMFMVAAAIAPSTMCSEMLSPHKTLVEVWPGGDDGLTQRLKASIEEKFKSSVDFQTSEGKKPDTLIVTIPSNVPWRENGGRTQVVYVVNFTSETGRDLGTSKGVCWDNDLTICATRIVTAARVVASEIK